MPAYQPNIPTGIVNLDVDYLNLKGNFQQLNIVYGTDHYPFDNATPNQGFHNLVTTPPFVDSPPTALPPVTTTNPKFYAFQQYPALGVLQYSRGPTNAVPTTLTKRFSASTPISLAFAATTNVIDFTGMAMAFCILTATDLVETSRTKLFTYVIWNGANIFIQNLGASQLAVTTAGPILQIINQTLTPSVTLNNVYWNLEIIRVQ